VVLISLPVPSQQMTMFFGIVSLVNAREIVLIVRQQPIPIQSAIETTARFAKIGKGQIRAKSRVNAY
jgi:hypothetical protein